MDFVVVGFGVGALGLLLGLVCLAWGARRYSQASRPAPPPTPTRALTGAVAMRDAGQVFLSAGGVVLLATVGALVTSLDDATGALVVTTTITVAALGILFWAFLHRARIPFLMPPSRVRPAAVHADRQPGGSVAALAILPPAAETVDNDPAQSDPNDTERSAAAPDAASAEPSPAVEPELVLADEPPDVVEPAHEAHLASTEESHHHADPDASVERNGKDATADVALHVQETMTVQLAAPRHHGGQLRPTTSDDDEDAS